MFKVTRCVDAVNARKMSDIALEVMQLNVHIPKSVDFVDGDAQDVLLLLEHGSASEELNEDQTNELSLYVYTQTQEIDVHERLHMHYMIMCVHPWR